MDKINNPSPILFFIVKIDVCIIKDNNHIKNRTYVLHIYM